MSVKMLQVNKKPKLDSSITKYEFRSFLPTNPNALNKSDIIEIIIQHQDSITATFDSKLYLSGTITATQTDPKIETKYKLIRNSILHLFSEIQYSLNGYEIETIRNPGVLTTIKGYTFLDQADSLEIAGWTNTGKQVIINANNQFHCEIPLSFIFSFAADYQTAIIDTKQALKLTRSHIDTDCYVSGIDTISISLDKVEWRVPFVELNEDFSEKHYNIVRSNNPINIWFRKCEIVELPVLGQNTNEIWIVKSLAERVNFILVGFHTNRRWNHELDASEFDHCNISNMKVYLNSSYYPLENLNMDISKNNYIRAYQMYLDIFRSYHGRERYSLPQLSYSTFKTHFIFAFDVSKQIIPVKSSVTELKIEINSKEPLPANTRAYAVLIGDTVMEYLPLTGIVKKKMIIDE